MPWISDEFVERLYRQAEAGRWALPRAQFVEALQSAAGRAFPDRPTADREIERHLTSLHLADLALACACAAGHEEAWDHFMREHRPVLYRAADAIDPTGGSRELADGLYADLYGLEDRAGQRRSLFRYFHGRSSLATWLRAVLAQRHVDRHRSRRRFDPLPEEDERPAPGAPPAGPDPDRPRYLALIRRALTLAISALAPRDRLRLACYYAQQLTLAQTGRVLGEHEATASRQLARTRGAIRRELERYLGSQAGLSEDQIARCFECALEDAGPLDLSRIFDRKNSASDRSI